jgi:hypothetical protein
MDVLSLHVGFRYTPRPDNLIVASSVRPAGLVLARLLGVNDRTADLRSALWLSALGIVWSGVAGSIAIAAALVRVAVSRSSVLERTPSSTRSPRSCWSDTLA